MAKITTIGWLVLLLIISPEMIGRAQHSNAKVELVSDFIHDYISIKYPDVELDTFIYVGVERQEMYVFMDGIAAKIYDVSTSMHGAGSQYGSNCTPTGLHCVKGKYGDDVPLGGIMVGKKFTGKVAHIEHKPIETGKDEITTRVITLVGMEDGVNKGGSIDTYKRKIYIHGTAEEGLIGKPASHGCIRMRNSDVIELFSVVTEGVPIVILDN